MPRLTTISASCMHRRVSPRRRWPSSNRPCGSTLAMPAPDRPSTSFVPPRNQSIEIYVKLGIEPTPLSRDEPRKKGGHRPSSHLSAGFLPMNHPSSPSSRREFLRLLALGTATVAAGRPLKTYAESLEKNRG